MGRKNRAYYSLFTIRRAVPHAVTGCYLMLLSAVIFALQILKNQLNQINPERENKKSAVFSAITAYGAGGIDRHQESRATISIDHYPLLTTARSK